MFRVSLLAISMLSYGFYPNIAWSAVRDDDGDVISTEDYVVDSDETPLQGDEVFVDQESQLELFEPGRFNAVTLSDSATFIMNSGGVFDDDDTALVLRDQSEALIRDGTVFSNDAYLLRAYDDATVTVEGGLYQTDPTGYFAFQTNGTSTLNVLGGDFSGLDTPDLFDIRGGSTVNIFGSDLALADNQLTGRLLDGNAIANTVQIADEGRLVIHNVPEPRAYLLMTMFVASLLLFARCEVTPS